MSNQSEIVGGRYALGELLGEGAFAFTYRAHDVRLGREVALKILRQVYARDTTFTARFTREAVAVASISHRNVVQVYDHGPHEDTLFIAMEYVAGNTLRQVRLNSGGRLQPTRAVEIIVQMLRGLQAVHRAGIIHRDIKPENILVGRDGVTRLADFGIATDPTGLSLTMTGTTLGTAAYMAPEQARGEALTPAADLYSVGVVLFELLAGGLPFMGENALAMMLAHQQVTPPSVRVIVPEAAIPHWLDATVMATLAKDPMARFRTARDLEQALLTRSEATGAALPLERTAPMPVVGLSPSTSGPTGPVARPAPQSNDRPGTGWVITVVLLLMVAGFAVAAAWWTGWRGSSDPEPTPTPRVVEVVTDDLTETPVELPTDEEATGEVEPSQTPAQIVPVETETPFEAPTNVAEPDPTETDVDLPEPTEFQGEATRTPTSEGNSPPIEPVD